MRRLIVAVASITCLAAAAPAFGGAVYVPYAADVTVGGVRYKTQVWASNRGSENRRLSTFFIGAGVNGTDRDGAALSSVGVLPGSSVLVQGVAGPNQVGMLEISGAPQLLISAQLVPVGNFLGRVGANLPVISSDNLLAAGSTAHLLALSRNSQQISDFLLVNISQQQASCSVSAFAANGSPIGSTAQVTMPALSLNRYSDVLNLLGQANVTGVRLTVSCNRTFYAYGVTFDSSSGAVNVLQPSELLTSTLVIPGGNDPDPDPEGCPTGAICFERRGTFFTPTGGEPYRRETFPTPNGSYSKAYLRVEVVNNGWRQPTTGIHMLWWLAINRHFRLLGFAAARGPGAHNVLFRHGMNIEATAKPRYNLPFTMVIGQTYINEFTYDAANRELEYKILDTGGNVLLHTTDRTNVRHIEVGNNEDFTADFSWHGDNPNEPPTYGWNYKNLTLQIWPE